MLHDTPPRQPDAIIDSCSISLLVSNRICSQPALLLVFVGRSNVYSMQVIAGITGSIGFPPPESAHQVHLGQASPSAQRAGQSVTQPRTQRCPCTGICASPVLHSPAKHSLVVIVCLRITPQSSAVRRSVRGSPRSPSQPCIIYLRMPLICYTHNALTHFHAMAPSIDIQCTPLRQL